MIKFEPAHEIMVLIDRIGEQQMLRRAAIRAVSPEPSLFAHIRYGSRLSFGPCIISHLYK